MTAALADLDGVLGHSAEAVDGRVRVSLEVSGENELRPTIFSLAKERGWTLWELHRERVSLEQVFHDLTQESGEGSGRRRRQPHDRIHRNRGEA